jgi:hypothetical protein
LLIEGNLLFFNQHLAFIEELKGDHFGDNRDDLDHVDNCWGFELEVNLTVVDDVLDGEAIGVLLLDGVEIAKGEEVFALLLDGILYLGPAHSDII